MFTGFHPSVFQFYIDLERNNDRGWWSENGYIYKQDVLPTMTEFLSELDPKWLPMTVYRPYRNVRFSPDKTPYKTASGAVGGDEDGIMHYFQVGASWVMNNQGAGLRTSRGMYVFSNDQLLRYYQAVHEDEDEVLRDRIWQVHQAGLSVGRSVRLSTAPRGYSRYHERVDLLQLGGLTASKYWPHDHGWLGTRRSLSMIQDAFEAASPLTDWLREHVGPAEL